MIAFGYLVLWVLAIIKLSASYSWTPVSPDQKFPLPDVIIPGGHDLTRRVSSNASLPIDRRWVSRKFYPKSKACRNACIWVDAKL